MEPKKQRIRRRLCSVKGCFNTSDSKKNVYFFPFPRNSPLKEKWMDFCNDEHLFDMSDNAVKQRYVCSAHFSPPCFSERFTQGSRLIRGSVPTIYVPYTSDDIRGLKAVFQLKKKIATRILTGNRISSDSNLLKSISVATKKLMKSTSEDILTLNKPVSFKSSVEFLSTGLLMSEQFKRSLKVSTKDIPTLNKSLNGKPSGMKVEMAKSNEQYKCSDDSALVENRIILAPVKCNQNTASLDNTPRNSSNSKEQTSVSCNDLKQNDILNRIREKNGISCSVPNCPVNLMKNCDIIFFHFPSYENDNERFTKWLTFTENKSIADSDISKDLYICSLHFDDASFKLSDRTRLISDACPTIPSSELSIRNVTALPDSEITSDDISEIPQKSELKIVPIQFLVNEYNQPDSAPVSSITVSNTADNNNNTDSKTESFNSDYQACCEQPLEDKTEEVETIKLKKYKFVVTVIKTIDERKDIKEMTFDIAKEVEKVVEDVIARAQIINKCVVSVNDNVNVNFEKSEVDITSVDERVSTTVTDKESNCCTEDLNEVVDLNEEICNIESKRLQIKQNCVDEFTTANRIYCLDNSNLCSSCGFLAKTVSRLNHHIKLHHEEQKCAMCGEILPDLIEYRKHLKKHKRKKRPGKRLLMEKSRKYYCDMCDINCLNSVKLTRHKLIVHNIGEYHTCNICNRMFATKYKMLYHKQTMHSTDDDVAFVCQYCGCTFKRHSNYFAHIKFMHLDQFKHFCSICNKRLRSPTALFIHMTNHVNGPNKEEHDAATNFINSSFGKRLKCLVCSVRFTNGDIESFKQHMEFHMNDVEIKDLIGDDDSKYHCVICDGRFHNIGKLASHRYYHHNEMPYICAKDDCASAFWSRWDLTLHQKVKHVKRTFKCKTCFEKFNSAQNRADHIKSKHPDAKETDRSVSCKICGKRFATRCHLQMHVVVHNSVKLYKCEWCDKVFKSANVFKLHLIGHEKNERSEQEKLEQVWRSKEQQENINKVFSDIREQVQEDIVAVENTEQSNVIEEEIIEIIDYSQF